MRKKIRLTEQSLYRMVKETLNALRESYNETRGGEIENDYADGISIFDRQMANNVKNRRFAELTRQVNKIKNLYQNLINPTDFDAQTAIEFLPVYLEGAEHQLDQLNINVGAISKLQNKLPMLQTCIEQNNIKQIEDIAEHCLLYVDVIEEILGDIGGISESVIRKALRESVTKFICEDNGRTAIIFHRVDWDGFNCGAIALMANPHADLIGWTWKDPLPDVSAYDRVILLDLTLTIKGDNSWMKQNADKLIWIDHHAFAISDPELKEIEGLRRDGIGACALAWEYFFGGHDIPLHILLCATYDVFRRDGKYVDWEDAWAYQLTLGENFLSYIADPNMAVQTAIKLINEPQDVTMDRIEYGYELEVERAKYEVEYFQGARFIDRNGIKICKLYSDGTKSPAHLIRTNLDNHTADLYMLCHTNQGEDGTYKVELRAPERSNIDCCEIARRYGGGGHVKASGCSMTKEEFEEF